ncbi:hypothetical protein DM02DRAFT_597174 [Periconia macrospinosa]|uniref:Prokaryotic-type class I peptide chain release factors domain-containing protein n=1 Tax=Periconia macrospinosa TaxID=97972 RepID=A0A2V1DHX8_9PLEO|nr:hypothetical protein DM02DRAFT_597174 [Periconia macrospinosa]
MPRALCPLISLTPPKSRLLNTFPTPTVLRRGLASGKPLPRPGHTTVDDGNIEAARTWLGQLHADTIPKSITELSFSRSSGPGGQNVNKVNSKATLKVPLDALLKQIPTLLHPQIRASRYVTSQSNAIIIQADDSRKQSDNAHSCYKRLFEAILEAGRTAIPGETSAAQAQRVKDLQKSDNERRLKSKKHHSAKKSSRRVSRDD